MHIRLERPHSTDHFPSPRTRSLIVAAHFRRFPALLGCWTWRAHGSDRVRLDTSATACEAGGLDPDLGLIFGCGRVGEACRRHSDAIRRIPHTAAASKKSARGSRSLRMPGMPSSTAWQNNRRLPMLGRFDHDPPSFSSSFRPDGWGDPTPSVPGRADVRRPTDARPHPAPPLGTCLAPDPS